MTLSGIVVLSSALQTLHWWWQYTKTLSDIQPHHEEIVCVHHHGNPVPQSAAICCWEWT